MVNRAKTLVFQYATRNLSQSDAEIPKFPCNLGMKLEFVEKIADDETRDLSNLLVIVTEGFNCPQ